MRAELPQMLGRSTLDLWASKEGSLPRKVSASLSLSTPEGELSDGVDSVDLTDLPLPLDDISSEPTPS